MGGEIIGKRRHRRRTVATLRPVMGTTRKPDKPVWSRCARARARAVRRERRPRRGAERRARRRARTVFRPGANSRPVVVGRVVQPVVPVVARS